MKNLNIIFWGNISYPNGMAATHRIQHFITACERELFNTNIIIPYYYDSFSNPREGENGKTKYRTLVNRRVSKIINLLLLPLMLLKGVWSLKRLYKKDTDNILYVYDGINLENLFIILSAKLLHYKIIIDVVEDYSLHEEKVSLFLGVKLKTIGMLERFTPNLVDGVIVISKYLEEKYKKLIGKTTKLILIPISASIPEHSFKKTSWNKPLQIVYSGSYGKKDGVGFLIKAFLLACKASKVEMKLNLLGKGSNKNEIMKYRNDPNIIIHGYVSDIKYYKFLKDADILCMTRVGSRYANAGFPFKLGEYLATGNSVLASNVSDIEYYLSDKRDIVLTEPESIQSIKEGILYLIEDFSRAKNIGINGYKKALIFFNEKLNGKKFIQFLET